jgi:dipeptidyl aminopeptidase/acylaminoacyl peptidase
LSGDASASTKNPERARFASPVFQVGQGDAPLLIIHGDKDTTVYLDQSQRIEEAYREAGLDVASPAAGTAAMHTSPPSCARRWRRS